MKIDNKKLREEIGLKRMCEYCGKPSLNPPDVHHLFSRGAGWVDIRCNLIALDRTCHQLNHAGKEPMALHLAMKIAEREKIVVADIEAVVMLIRRLPNGASPRLIIQLIVDELSLSAGKLARKELTESGVLK